MSHFYNFKQYVHKFDAYVYVLVKFKMYNKLYNHLIFSSKQLFGCLVQILGKHQKLDILLTLNWSVSKKVQTPQAIHVVPSSN